MADSISELIGLGADAMSNMFEVTVSPPTDISPDVTVVNNLKFRVRGFTPPTPTAVTYPIHWKTVSITKIATKIELDRTFDLEFRLDSNYDTYGLFLKWEKLYKDVVAGGVTAAPESGALGTIIVAPLTGTIDLATSTDTINAAGDYSWSFSDVWVESVTPPTYTTDDATALTITVKFRFGGWNPPSSAQ